MGLVSIAQQLDRWLPERFEDNPLYKAETKIRARVLLGLYISSLVIILISFAVFLGLQIFSPHRFPMAFLCLAAMGVITAIQVLMFYRAANIGASAIIFSMVFFSSNLVLMILTGGWNSPVKQLYFCSPMISFLVGGRQEGLYTSGLVLVTGLCTLVAYKMDFQLFQIMRQENIDIAAAVVWVISINVLVSCFLVYDNILDAYCKSGSAPRARVMR